MKSFKILRKLFVLGRVLSKVAFILSIVGFCLCIAGMVNLNLENGEGIKLGGVTLHDMVVDRRGYGIGSVTAAILGVMVVCAGEAVLAKFAEICFAHALNAETPFTFGFAKETLRLGILAIAIPLGCAIAGSIVEAIAAAWMNAPKIAILQKNFNNTLSASVGVMFILVSLLCRSGAELLEKNRAEG